jgi:hypothetical protein
MSAILQFRKPWMSWNDGCHLFFIAVFYTTLKAVSNQLVPNFKYHISNFWTRDNTTADSEGKWKFTAPSLRVRLVDSSLRSQTGSKSDHNRIQTGSKSDPNRDLRVAHMPFQVSHLLFPLLLLCRWYWWGFSPLRFFSLTKLFDTDAWDDIGT